MSVYLSAIGNEQFEDSSGNPANGFKLYTYAAGSTTPLTTYTTSLGNVAQANPIVLNSLGFTDNAVWVTGGLSYKFVLKTAADVTVKEWDGVTGVGDVTAAVDQWVASQLTPTYSSVTTFSLAGDQTSTFHVGRRIKTTNSGGTVYATIVGSSFGVVTTINTSNDGGLPLDSGLSAVSYGLISADNTSTPLIRKSGTTTTVFAPDDTPATPGSFLQVMGQGDGGHVLLQTSDIAGAAIGMTSGTATWRLLRNGGSMIGDTSNANNSKGQTINQGTADDEITSWKSSDIDHGVTTITETDTYGFVMKFTGAGGGLSFSGVRETGGGTGMAITGYADTPDTTAGTAASAQVMAIGYNFSGTGKANATANALVFGVRTQVGGSDRGLFYVDEDGDLFVDGATTLTAFDSMNDALACRAIDTVLEAEGVIASEWDRFVTINREDLERAKIITKPEHGDPMLCITKHARLLNGAVWQGYERDMNMERRIATLESQLFDATRMIEELKGLLPKA